MDTTLATTLQSYRDACKSMGAKPSYLMITVLQKHINISKELVLYQNIIDLS